MLGRAMLVGGLGWLAAATPLRAQVAPAATGTTLPSPGFSLPTLGGSLQYAVTGSETVASGYYGNSSATSSTNISGDLAYLAGSKTHPLSIVYAGVFASGGLGQPTTFAQTLALSQVLATRAGQFVISDLVSYLPQTPNGGLSGVPGTGDLNVAPVAVGPVTGQAALTTQADQVGNTVVGSATRRLAGKVDLAASASYGIERFTGGSDQGLLDTSQLVVSGGPTYRIDARSSATFSYAYSTIGYQSSAGTSLMAQGANGGYSRQWTRWLATSATLGPQWITLKLPGMASATTLDLAANASATAQARAKSFNLSYVRGTNTGFGLVQGSFSDSLNATVQKSFGRTWSASVLAAYTRSSSLPGAGVQAFSARTLVTGAQASRGLTRSTSLYLSYNTQHQSTGGAFQNPGAFRGFSQIVGFGLTYAPRPRLFGAQ